jgi:hypothetical protein
MINIIVYNKLFILYLLSAYYFYNIFICYKTLYFMKPLNKFFVLYSAMNIMRAGSF